MNLILFSSSETKYGNTVVFNDHRHQHILKVLKSRIGDTLKLGEINGTMGVGCITEITENQTVCKLSLTDSPPAPSPLTVVLALPRPKALRRCLKFLTELGVKEIHIIHCYKVEKSYWQSPLIGESKIQKTLIEGLSQAKDTVKPSIYFHQRFKPFVEDTLPLLMEDKSAFIGHPYLETNRAMPKTQHKEKLIIIGPEGGFIDYELDLIAKQGVSPFSLGDRVYSVETALSIFCARLLLPS
jgi:RsmE family RNA methyltransferase